jgi:hypothetical protein
MLLLRKDVVTQAGRRVYSRVNEVNLVKAGKRPAVEGRPAVCKDSQTGQLPARFARAVQVMLLVAFR